MYKRYVDDINLAAKETPLGTRYVNGALVIDENAIESDRVIPGDKRMMDIIKLIGNDVHPSILLEVDCPSNYDDGKFPILDLRMWIDTINGHNRILHELYSKEIPSKARKFGTVVAAKENCPYTRDRTRNLELLGRHILGGYCSARKQDDPTFSIFGIYAEVSIRGRQKAALKAFDVRWLKGDILCHVYYLQTLHDYGMYDVM